MLQCHMSMYISLAFYLSYLSVSHSGFVDFLSLVPNAPFHKQMLASFISAS